MSRQSTRTGGAPRGADDLARDGDDVAVGAAAADPEGLAAIVLEARAVGEHDVFLEEPDELLPLRLGGDVPVAPEGELRDPLDVEIAAEQLAKARLALRRRDLAPAQHVDGAAAEIVDEGRRVRRGEAGAGGEEEREADCEDADQAGATHHLWGTSDVEARLGGADRPRGTSALCRPGTTGRFLSSLRISAARRWR